MSDEHQLREARLRREVDRLDSVGQALFESFRSLGMDNEAALAATRGRDGRSDGTRSLDESSSRSGGGQFDDLVGVFRRMGLTESGAEQAAAGRHSTPAGARLAESRAASPAGGRGRSRSRPDAEWVAIRNAAREVGAIGANEDVFDNEAARPFIRAVDEAQARGQSLREAINATKDAWRDTVSEAGGPTRDGQRQTGTPTSIREVRNR